ncbi:MAG: hypothetical protein ACI81L_001256 [Verrucomicrobiales bacterium]|jgi:hypothetical protein
MQPYSYRSTLPVEIRDCTRETSSMSSEPTIGFLHPGAMGSTLAKCCVAETRLWVDAGRSGATAERAEEAGLTAVSSLTELSSRADIIVSICPPAAAANIADEVAASSFEGIYVDANAIAPKQSRAIAERFEHFVDASVIGPPPREPGATRLYLSGPTALTQEVANLWTGSFLDARTIGAEPGEASALKMAYAAWTKGSAALLLAVAALAESEGVAGPLHDEWNLSQPDLGARVDASAAGAGPKAWRFVGEMEQIAATFADAGLPDGFHLAAADTYKRLAEFKDSSPSRDDVVGRLSAP